MTRSTLSDQPTATRDSGDRRRFALLGLLCVAATIAYVQRAAIEPER